MNQYEDGVSLCPFADFKPCNRNCKFRIDTLKNPEEGGVQYIKGMRAEDTDRRPLTTDCLLVAAADKLIWNLSETRPPVPKGYV